MIKKLKGFYLIVSSLIITILHLPFSFGKSAAGNNVSKRSPADLTAKYHTEPLPAPAPAPAPTPSPAPLPVSNLRSVYDSLHLNVKGLSQQAYNYAKQGFDKLVSQGKIANNSIISIVDFSLPSNKKRLFILDLEHYRILFNSLVSHGRNSGYETVTAFSNKNESYMSSPGFYITRETYNGKNGYSLKLEGLERGINDKAYERGIVIHGAPYVNEAVANSGGFVGRSQGCPAVPLSAARPIINTIRNGTCLFIYHPSYINRSVVLN